MAALRSPDSDLLDAIDALVDALEQFRAAYVALARADDVDAARLRAVLDEAERRVDEARAALAAAEDALARR